MHSYNHLTLHYLRKLSFNFLNKNVFLNDIQNNVINYIIYSSVFSQVIPTYFKLREGLLLLVTPSFISRLLLEQWCFYSIIRKVSVYANYNCQDKHTACYMISQYWQMLSAGKPHTIIVTNYARINKKQNSLWNNKTHAAHNVFIPNTT